MAKPTVIGRYAIYDRIAAGGMATVHIGRLIGQVGFARTVAIKRLHPQYAMEPEFVAMFLDEARLAARIRHPNVVPTLDVVAMEGELFLVMEYVHGESLARLLGIANSNGERIPLAHVSSILSGVLHGLHAAHEAKSESGEPLGIVHRDISPQNVLVGSDGITRVLDFGIARAIGQIHTTREGQIKGKFAYMAPEQLHGGKATPCTDVFAAGVVLWECLTGRRLFKGENEAEMITKILTQPIPRPSSVVDVLPAVEDVVMRALARNPDDRFPTAEAMAIAIEDAVAPSLQRKVAEWVKRTAASELSTRTELVTRIESNSDGTQVSEPVPSPPESDKTEVVAKEGSQFSSISVSKAVASEKPKLGRAIIGGVGVVMAIAIIIVAIALHSSGSPPTTAAPPATSAASPSTSTPIAVETSAPIVAPPIATSVEPAVKQPPAVTSLDAGKVVVARPHPPPTGSKPDASLWGW